MEIFLLIVHVIVCFVLILSILMQPGKGGGLSGGAFGGAGSGTSSMFGGSGAVPLLAKVTTYAGVLFALTCVSLWYAGHSSNSDTKTAAERLLEQSGTPMQSVPQPFSPVEPVDATQKPASTDSGQ
ncbi:MAG: preprotein translocase subunit SecG [bacterium]|jgi:preprotein translocase subunit SecG|nr:preprotein translocase subunit SecG [bacterium]